MLGFLAEIGSQRRGPLFFPLFPVSPGEGSVTLIVVSPQAAASPYPWVSPRRLYCEQESLLVLCFLLVSRVLGEFALF